MSNFAPCPSDKSIVKYIRAQVDQNVLLGVREIQHFVNRAENTKILRDEYCSGATLHRGFYHPSPVYDLIVGNTTRGKLCRKSNLRLTHHFYYDYDDKLARIEYLNGGRISHVEYLGYCGQSIYGITVDCNGFISAVSEERYVHGRINFFSLTRCYYIDGEYKAFDYHTEEYYYDESGLLKCHFVNYSPESGYLVDRIYTFCRDNGFLVSYSTEPTNLNAEQQAKYIIKKKRKA